MGATTIGKRALVACGTLCALSTSFAQPAALPEPTAHRVQSVAQVALVNAGFESTEAGQLGAPPGWWAVQHAGPTSYVFTLDADRPRSGLRSLKVENIGPEPFGSIYQKMAAAPYHGKTLRFGAWIRTEKTTGNRFGAGAGLTLHALKAGSPIAHVMMRKDAVKGTTDWARHEVMLNVPNGAEHVEVGLILYGPGIAWVDDVALDIVTTPPVADGPVKHLR